MPEYTPILHLKSQHNYFTNNLCEAILMEPSQACLQLIRNHRLRLVNRPGGLDLYAPLGLENKLFIPIDSTVNFQFVLKTRSKDFHVYTALPSKDSQGQYLISNQTQAVLNPANFADYGGLIGNNNQEIAGSFGSLTQTHRFQFSLQGGKSNQLISLGRAPVRNAAISHFSFANAMANDSFDPNTQSWELTNEQQLKFSASPPKDTGVIANYPIAGRQGSGNLALIDIKPGQAFNQKSDGALSYTLVFKAKKTPWQYLLILRNGKQLNKSNEDKWSLKTSSNIRHEVRIQELSLTTAPDQKYVQANLAWARLKKRIEGTGEKVYFIYAKNPISFQENTAFDLVLQYQKSTNIYEDIIANLPSPLAEENGLKVIFNPATIK